MLDFTSFWCFRLNAISRKVSRLWNARCSQYGVTAAQSFVLYDVRDHEGTSIKDIAARIELDSSAITGLVDRLEKMEMVKRQDDPNDRRGIRVFLTQRGKELTENELIPEAREFNQYLKGMVAPDIAGIFQHSLNIIDAEINKVTSENRE